MATATQRPPSASNTRLDTGGAAIAAHAGGRRHAPAGAAHRANPPYGCRRLRTAERSAVYEGGRAEVGPIGTDERSHAGGVGCRGGGARRRGGGPIAVL